jgi:hypothetical protein
MLKIGGQLVAITSKHFMFASDEKSKSFRDWLNINYDDKKLKIYDNDILEVDIEEREQEKFENENRKMKMDVIIIHITKKSDVMDNMLLDEKYYDIEEMRQIGNDIINNITTLDKENITYEQLSAALKVAASEGGMYFNGLSNLANSTS